MKRNRVGIGLYVALILVVVFLWYSFSNTSSSTYSMKQFRDALDNDEITSAEINQNEQVPTGSVEITTKAGGNFILYVSDVVEIQETLDDAGVVYTVNNVPQSGFMEQ